MAYNGPRRKLKLQKACEAIDRGVTIEHIPFNAGGRYTNHYLVRDSSGAIIGWTDGNEGSPAFAWSRALGELQRRKAAS